VALPSTILTERGGTTLGYDAAARSALVTIPVIL